MRYMDVTLSSGERVLIIGFQLSTLIGLAILGFLCIFIGISAYYLNNFMKNRNLKKSKKMLIGEQKKLEEEQRKLKSDGKKKKENLV
ncbi:hypothetical protein B9Z55_016043 [Caenorhabditis nigoni]|uniref:Uncharacterized protein n=2 Tax=Caenorhabditis nigoni TaxID=1611254 RepID=A0A2G5UCX6_9PELO|nr:hypothetical protein B9Z55_016043 [Caenorhabditis nigoni]